MSIITRLNRLSLQTKIFNPNNLTAARNISVKPTLLFQFTPVLFAEPLKKKKRLDPAIIRAREDRKKKKMEKQIRKLEKNAKQLKPVYECEIPNSIVDNRMERQRQTIAHSEEVLEGRVLLEKAWAKYKHQERYNDLQIVDKIIFSQQKALDELRKESEELYQEAIQIDHGLIPYASKGPVNTPKIDKYEAPDGDYLDTSRKW